MVLDKMSKASTKPTRLIDTLRRVYPESSLRTLKQMLKGGRVLVNGEAVRSATHRLFPKDEIKVASAKKEPELPAGLSLVHEDRQIIVAEKSEGMLSVRTTKEKEDTVYAHLLKYLRAKSAGAKLFVVHRLDRGASGLLVFAKTVEAQKKLRSLFAKHNIQRKYTAVVEGKVKRKSGTIRSYLAENIFHHVYSTRDKSRGKLAITHYKVVEQSARYTTVEVTLETGRKNQIRVHLAGMGHPVAGDPEYGAKTNPIRRLALHAIFLGFTHPSSGRKMQFNSNTPTSFETIQKPNVRHRREG